MKITTNKITRHRELVKKNFSNLIAKLQERAYLHDLSKFEAEEFDGFEEADKAGLYKDYGSPDYHKKLKENKGIALHLSKNSHHPDFHQIEPTTGCVLPNGQNENMSFLDIVEMVIDWKSASETYSNDFLDSIEYSIERYKFDEKHEWLIRKIAEIL